MSDHRSELLRIARLLAETTARTARLVERLRDEPAAGPDYRHTPTEQAVLSVFGSGEILAPKQINARLPASALGRRLNSTYLSEVLSGLVGRGLERVRGGYRPTVG